jgi:hypothetical protein
MIVNDLYLVGVTISPAKTDPPLIVDANAVLPGAIASELLESVPWWHPEIVQRFRRIHGDQLPEHRPEERGGIAPNTLALEQGLSVPIGEALDHLRS